jgi:nucleoside-diphosphate-sugar epimerase
MHTPRRVLITGGLGMIGSRLVKRLVKEGYGDSIYIVDNLWRGSIDNIKEVADLVYFHKRDLSEPRQLDDLLEDYEIDTVIHLADIVAGIDYVFANEGMVFHKNLLINSNVIDSVRRSSRVKAFVNVGTACSFPKSLQTSLTSQLREDQLYPADPETSYGWSKLMGCYETELLGKETEVKTCSILFHNVYGSPSDYGIRSQVIPSLIRKAIEYPAEPFVVWGSGEQGRAFLHVDDAAEALLLGMRKGLGNGIIQIGPETCTSIREIAENIVAISGKQIKIEYDLTKPEGDRGRCADASKARDILGWSPTVSLEEGLRELYRWIELDLVNKNHSIPINVGSISVP